MSCIITIIYNYIITYYRIKQIIIMTPFNALTCTQNHHSLTVIQSE